MKLLVFALCCAVLSQQVISQESLDINDISICLKNIVQSGSPEFGIPILDPLNSELSVDLATFGINLVSGTLDLKNLLLQGISGFNLEDVDISINGNELTLNFKLIEPRITIDADYNVNAHIYGFPAISNGKLNAIIVDLVALVNITADLQIGDIIVENFQISPKIGNVDVKISGILGTLVSTVVNTFFNNNSKELGVIIGNYLKQIINNGKGTEYDINNIINVIFTECINL
ncbi:PREDICTED: uncharacterized protein LOC108563646 [Nicrophorus vespilloides]|uniref:Uncharacterized protein LOC108563646 n=1 Tax=Nicrophorus vespilloides TaxID=110193 RepID=A0ABM1MTH5_NICVS|nr:PREDICTED: uncharacterized protein LOC108563646 [Nicrophorus vespilloides]